MIYTIISILIAVIWAYIGYLKGFRKMWVMLFNVLISVYLAIMVTRAVCLLADGIGQYQYYKALLVIAVAAVVFLILSILAKFLAKNDYIHSVPGLFDDIAGGILGFFTGLICCGFVITTLYMFVSNIKLPDIIENQITSASTASVVKSCQFTGSFSMQSVKSNDQIAEIVQWLLGKTDNNTDSNADNDTNDIDNAKDNNIDHSIEDSSTEISTTDVNDSNFSDTTYMTPKN